jgi:hypothetical protein
LLRQWRSSPRKFYCTPAHLSRQPAALLHLASIFDCLRQCSLPGAQLRQQGRHAGAFLGGIPNKLDKMAAFGGGIFDRRDKGGLWRRLPTW